VALSEGLLKVKLNTTSDPSIAEAGVIVATVGASSLSSIVPIAVSVVVQCLCSTGDCCHSGKLFSSIVFAVVGTIAVAVVVSAKKVTVTGVVV
jgi:hypothetical protein